MKNTWDKKTLISVIYNNNNAATAKQTSATSSSTCAATATVDMGCSDVMSVLAAVESIDDAPLLTPDDDDDVRPVGNVKGVAGDGDTLTSVVVGFVVDFGVVDFCVVVVCAIDEQHLIAAGNAAQPVAPADDAVNVPPSVVHSAWSVQRPVLPWNEHGVVGVDVGVGPTAVVVVVDAVEIVVVVGGTQHMMFDASD